MSDSDLTSIPITIVPANSPMLGSADPLTHLAADIDARFAAGKAARLGQVAALDARLVVQEARALIPGPKGDTGAAGAASTVPGPKGDTGATGAASIVPGPKGDTGGVGAASTVAGPKGDTGATGAAGTNANPVAATLTTLGSIKANITQIARTTTPISVSVSSISVLGASLLPSVSVTVTGVALGDFVQAAFAASPPTGLTISAAQATAANTVLVTFAATQAATLTAGAQSLNFCWTR